MLINNFDKRYLFYVAKMQQKQTRPQLRFVNRWFEFVNRKKSGKSVHFRLGN